MNKVVLVGHLTKDPELRYSSSNIAVCNFTVAINRPFANAEGVREADFINCIVWRKQAENMKKYTQKGSLVAVDGGIRTRSYTAQDGTKRYVTEVQADSVQFLNSKGSSTTNNNVAPDNNAPYDYDVPTEEVATTNVENDPYLDFGSSIELTDDLPF